jgi:hypothetical protein
MPNPTLNWKALAPVAVGGGGTIDELLDAIYTALGAATYDDASGRTPGAGSAWTVSRFQDTGTTEAVYATPPVDGLNVRAIIAGFNGAKTPTMRAPDSWLSDCLLVSLNKNSGAFNAWDDAAPFTTGEFFGYWKTSAAGKTWTQVRVYESQEGLIVACKNDLNHWWNLAVGAVMDPLSADALDAESDGRVYGMFSQGSAGTTGRGAAVWTSTGNDTFWYHHTGGHNPHGGHFTPGAGTIVTGGKVGTNIAPDTQKFLKPSGRLVLAEIHIVGTRHLGRLRGIYMIRDAQMGQKIDGGAFHIMGGRDDVDEDAWALEA